MECVNQFVSPTFCLSFSFSDKFLRHVTTSFCDVTCCDKRCGPIETCKFGGTNLFINSIFISSIFRFSEGIWHCQPTEILIGKLWHHRGVVRGLFLDWLKSFLTKRQEKNSQKGFFSVALPFGCPAPMTNFGHYWGYSLTRSCFTSMNWIML